MGGMGTRYRFFVSTKPTSMPLLLRVSDWNRKTRWGKRGDTNIDFVEVYRILRDISNPPFTQDSSTLPNTDSPFDDLLDFKISLKD